MLDAGLHRAGGNQRACSVQPLPSRRNLNDTSTLDSSLNFPHGPTDRAPVVPFSSVSVPLSRPRSAPPLLPSQAMTGRLSRPPTPPYGDTSDVRDHADADAEIDSETKLPRRRARGTQVSPRELPSEPQMPDHREGDHGRSVAGLSELFRSNKEQAQACAASKAKLYQLHIACARTARLIHAARAVQHTLAECVKTEDKPSFVNLFDAFHNTLAHASTPLASDGNGCSTDEPEYPVSFIDSLSSDARNAVLGFVTKVKSDGEFLAERLGALGYKELTALLPEKVSTRSNDSVFGSSHRTSSRLSRHLEGAVDGQIDMLTSYEFGSPLETLILSTRKSSSGPLCEDVTATEVWARVGAELIASQRPGSERFVPAVIDVWGSCSPWPGKDRLELWILQTLQAGAFLLERPASQTFQMRAQGNRDLRPEDEVRRETFYTQAVDSLLDLLGDCAGYTIIPDGAAAMCAAIHEKLNFAPVHRSGFPRFIALRWLMASFLPDAIAFPEMHGMVSDRYISEQARARILLEVANRTRKAIYDVIYSSRFGPRPTPDTVSRVGSILNHFHARATSDPQAQSTPKALRPTRSNEKRKSEFVMLSSYDVTTMVDALYPVRRPTSMWSDFDVASSGLTSSSSSISGFSLFRNTVPPDATTSLASPGSPDATSPSNSWAVNADPSSPFAAVENGLLPPDHGSNEQILRDACLAIEDFVASAAQPELSQWAILVSSKDSPLRPIRDELALYEDHFTASTGIDSSSAEYRSCKHALESLLGGYGDDDEIYFSSLTISRGIDGSEATILVDGIHQAFEDRRLRAEAQSDFLTAYAWFQRLQAFHSWMDSGERSSKLSCLVDDLHSQAEKSTTCFSKVTTLCNQWISSNGSSLGSSIASLADVQLASRQLRNKMWYVADVRISSAYDEARSIASALLVMGKPKLPSNTRLAPPLRHSFGSKINQVPLHLKTEAQILDILSAAPKHGGPNKLSDDQTRALLTWMDQNRVENLCRGEERLHKLCMEIRKCIDRHLVGNPNQDVAPLWSWSNPLFGLDAMVHASQTETAVDPYSMLRLNFEHLGIRKMRSDMSVGSMSIGSRPLSSRSSKDFFESRSPTWTSKSSAPFWSPAMTEAQTFSSATSIIGSVRAKRAPRRMASSRKALNVSTKNSEEDFMQQLRQHLTSLLLSDLTTTMFNNGSETDRAFWKGLGGELADKHMRNILSKDPNNAHEAVSRRQFQFTKAYRRLMGQFTFSPCPFAKLGYLHDVDALIERQDSQLRKEQLIDIGFNYDYRLDGTPANGLLRISDMKVDGFRRLFCDPTTRPASIFRDLQFIAALVPAHTLETTPQGRAFWNAAVAISGLKQEVRNIMVETADSIIAYQSNNRGHHLRSTSSAAQQERDSAAFSPPARTPSAEDIARYTMADAAWLLQITAKEGDPVAQRELGTLYLTHPELMGHIIAPFTRPRDVFREELESKWRKNQDPTRCDPATMCVAHHWMSLSSKGGDVLAKEYLRQREEMDRV